MTSIFKRAKELDVREDVLIFGEPARGKSRLAVELAKKYTNVLYVAFGSMYPDLPDEWMTYQVFDLASFKKLQSAIVKENFDCIIFDDYNASMALHHPTEDTPTRQEYGTMAVRWSMPVTKVRANCDNFIMTINVVDDEDDNGGSKGLKLDVTPRSLKNVVGLFNYRYLVWKGAKQTDKGTEPAYYVVTDPIDALKFNVKNSSVAVEKLLESRA